MNWGFQDPKLSRTLLGWLEASFLNRWLSSNNVSGVEAGLFSNLAMLLTDLPAWEYLGKDNLTKRFMSDQIVSLPFLRKI